MKLAGLIVGVPREIMNGEDRVALLPENVKPLCDVGAKVFIESGAGIGCGATDTDYQAVGAEIYTSAEELYSDADIILKVKEPGFNESYSKHEIDMMHNGQTLIAFLHPAAPANHDMVQMLKEQGVTSLTLDGIPRISRAQSMDALTSMSTVAVYKSVLMAANLLKSFMPMMGTAVGVIPPAKVLVVGTGVAGLQAVATARRLGATVTAVDIRPPALEQAASLGAKSLDSGVPPEEAMGKGGYAKALSERWLEHERSALAPEIATSDIVILAALVPGAVAPQLVTEESVKMMKPGSVIVDIAVDQGGNCSVTKAGEVSVLHDVTIVGIKNIPGHMARSAAWLFGRNMSSLLLYLAEDGKLPLDMSDEIVASSLVTKEGEILH
ncbi:MAG: NAD(P) transhydrogenase subunit alpha, partial [Lentisphaerae bacterium]|nr:NAD(P) transhydrogenase subunit alpha [Lentisphaerota bacterium]